MLKVNSKPETDELELIYLFLDKEEFYTKNVHIYRLIKNQEIRYVIHKYTIYILLDIEENYFFSLDSLTLKIQDEKIIQQVGLAPSLNLIGDEYIIAIGGLNSDTVNLFEIETNNWIHIGRMCAKRYGAYSLYDEAEKIIYICGGRDESGDNSIDIEYFSLKDLPNNIEIRKREFQEDYCLLRIFPVPFPLGDLKTFIICGGSSLFQDEDTNTSTIVSLATHKCDLQTDLHKELSSKNPNLAFNGNFVYFFINDNEVIKFNSLEINFDSVYREEEETKR